MVRRYSPSDDVNYTIGKKIQEIRTSSGLSRHKIAKEIGVTHQQFQKYEEGVNKISASRLFLLARALNTSVKWFFEGDIMDTNNKITLAAFRNLMKCTVEQQATINNVIKSILKLQNQGENKEDIAV